MFNGCTVAPFVLSTIILIEISTAQGQSSSSPTPLGVTAATTVDDPNIFDPSPPCDVKLTILKTVRSGKAWDIIRELNGSNKLPKHGFEYILALVRFEYYPRVDLSRGKSFEMKEDEFTAASADGKWYESPSITLPKPRLKTKLSPGESSEGWVAFEVPQDDNNPRMFFARGNIWFQLYQ
jgi:hypothetical protein